MMEDEGDGADEEIVLSSLTHWLGLWYAPRSMSSTFVTSSLPCIMLILLVAWYIYLNLATCSINITLKTGPVFTM
jgi:hypothetical protein